MSEGLRVGLVGAGLIAESWVPALRAAGLQVSAVSARPGSPRVREFALRHEIPRVRDGWRTMLAQPADWDALVIATWPDGTPEVLVEAMSLGVPILVEKPVAWNTTRLRALCQVPHDQVIVGYNRRFYRSVQAARAEVRGGGPVLAQLTLPTAVGAPSAHDPTGKYMQEFYESVSAHGIDLTRFILGDLELQHVRRLQGPIGNLIGLVAILTTDRGDLLQITGNWAAASNYSLTINRPGRRFELLPFEIASVYQGLEVVPPSQDYPVRRYTPKLLERIALEGIDRQQKAGFVGQAEALKAMLAGREPPPCTARLEDAFAVTALCEQLTGVILGDTNPNVAD